MSSIAISSGHGLKIRGASGYLDEVNEARKVVDRVNELIQASGGKCIPFHDNTSTSQSQNLNTIVAWHNKQSRDYDVSVHFNAYQTTSKAMGTETLYVSSGGQAMASKLSPTLAVAGKFLNRGPKKRTDLAFLNGTNKPAILVEVCFVDSSTDAELYRQNFDHICVAIAETISGKQMTVPPVEPPTEPPIDTEQNRIDIVGDVRGDVTVIINGSTVLAGTGENVVDLQIDKQGDVALTIQGEDFHEWPAVVEPEPGEPEIPENQTDIICTVFGGKADPNKSAYAPYDTITDTELSVALPFKFQGDRPKVRVIHRANGKEVICDIRDLGPWLIDDDYWNTGARPLAEICFMEQKPLPSGPNKGQIGNGAGIDITPGAAKAIGLNGKGNVDWEFAEPPVA